MRESEREAERRKDAEELMKIDEDMIAKIQEIRDIAMQKYMYAFSA